MQNTRGQNVAVMLNEALKKDRCKRNAKGELLLIHGNSWGTLGTYFGNA
jgi:hypothetical protein